MAIFVPPGRDERLKALGLLKGLPDRLRRLLLPGEDFQPLRPPNHGDWLGTYVEPGQTFEDFTETASIPDSRSRRLYLLPLEGPSPLPRACLDRFRRFTEAFFMAEVAELKPLRIDDGAIASRTDPGWGLPQWCGADILQRMARGRPSDALCVLALTSADIYPHALVDFAFGVASGTQRVGVCSFARFGQPYCREAAAARPELACRSCRLIAHEIGHLLGVKHCVYYTCLMNGSTSVAEADGRPLHLCPIDLRKLQWLLGFDPVERYRCLLATWQELGAGDEAAWVRRRLSEA